MRLLLAAILLSVFAAGLPGSARPGCCPGAGGDDFYPSWSPNGALIAFSRIGQLDTGTYLVHPDGSGVKLVSRRSTFSWAPYGQRLVVGGGGIEIVNTTGQIERVLTEERGDWYPAWSPDGRLIAFRRDGAIWLVSSEGGAPRKVAAAAPPRRGQWRMSWSPDSTQLVYAASRRFHKRLDDQIHVVRSDGTGDHVVAGSRFDEEEPVWSPEGRRIAFSSGPDKRPDVYVVDADGSNLASISPNPAFDGYPAWSPDGSTLAFTSTRSGSTSLHVVSAAGGLARKVMDYPESRLANWSPDGSRLAFSGRGACRRTGILTVVVDGGGSDLVTNDCYIAGTDGNDTIAGTWDRDIVTGGAGNDAISLDTGDDEGSGDAGADLILGGRGNDVIVGGAGRDSLFGENGNDRLFTVDAEVDSLNCGRQVDWVVADRIDQVGKTCEHVRRVG